MTESNLRIVELICRGSSAAEICRRLGRYGEREYQLILQGKRRKYIRREADRIMAEFSDRFRRKIQAAHASALDCLDQIIQNTQISNPTIADALAAAHQLATDFPKGDGEQHAERGITAGEAILLIHNRREREQLALDQGGNGDRQPKRLPTLRP